MTQAISPPQSISKDIYDRDLHLWLETAIAQLKAGDLENLDVENLIEELEGLAGRDRKELDSRLITLLEHILKRCYVNLPDCFKGWQNTILTQRDELSLLLEQSPSLRRYFSDRFDRSFHAALRRVDDGYPSCQFPKTWQFERDVDALLSVKFWEL